MLEFSRVNWSPAPHLDLDALLASRSARTDFLARIAAHGLSIDALNCSGNPLLPGPPEGSAPRGHQQDDPPGGLLGVERVVRCPAVPAPPVGVT